MGRFFCIYFTLAGSLLAGTISIATGPVVWSAAGPNVGGTVAAAIVASPDANWLLATGGSSWISTLATDGAGTTGLSGSYTFSITITTDGLGGSLSYITAADNQDSVVVKLNNAPINTFNHPGNTLNAGPSVGCAYLPAASTLCGPPPAQGAVGPGTINWAAGGAGTITILATVNNTSTGPSPVGFLLLGTLTAGNATIVPFSSSVPEPTTFALFGLGAVGFAALRRYKLLTGPGA